MLWNSIHTRLKEERVLRKTRRTRGNNMLGFFISEPHGREAIAIDHEKELIPVKFLGKGHTRNRDGLQRSLQRIKEAAGEGRCQPAVWGIKDKLLLDLDLSDYFNDLIRVEDGLLTQTPSGKPIRSVILNYRGIYYDGRRESDLEQGLNKLSAGYAASNELAAAVISKVVAERVTKYNLTTSSHVALPKDALLVIGQVNGDQAIEATETVCRSNQSFIEYLCTAVPVTNVSSIYYKPHPRNMESTGEIERISNMYPFIRILPAEMNILPLLEQCPTVATMTSGAGLEAALRGCDVHCFGLSFYSNWGFTTDYIKCARRKNRLTAADVFAYVQLKQTKYVDMDLGLPISVMEAFELNHLAVR